MKKLLTVLFISTSLSVYAANTVKGNFENISGEFRNGTALSFTSSINKSLVIECNESYGVIGLSDINYVAYNRIFPGLTISSLECDKAISEIKAGKTLSFTYEKDETSCN